ncbi:MAG: glycosyltransferase [Myxococcales bacterium]|nr:glycosyltransferase [Myxococcales bacterium]MDH5306450.1 glycosyltransferase [Myxococcales bacterium]MDH5567307.1 glycosyltransferase [Myxococcales bacterium]
MSEIRSVDLVIPVYNEEANLPKLLDRLKADLEPLTATWRAIFVDDGSRDRSWQLISEAAKADHRIVGIRLGRNYGQHAAIFAGFARCDADAVVTLDADLQNPPAEIPRLLGSLAEGYDVVGGWRQQRQDRAFRRYASFWMNRLISRATGVPLRDYGCMLRAYRMDVVRMMRESGEVASYIPALAHCFTDRMTEIPVAHAERAEGESRYSFRKLIGLLLDLLTGFSMFPLRALSTFGVMMALGGLGFAALLLLLRFAFGAEWAAEGVFSLFAVLFVFVGAQFLAFGLLGEYIGRIYDEVRRRPQYVVRAEVGDRVEEGLRRAL